MSGNSKQAKWLIPLLVVFMLIVTMACSISIPKVSLSDSSKVTVVVQTVMVEVTSNAPQAPTQPPVADTPTVEPPTPEPSATAEPPTPTAIVHVSYPQTHGWYNSALWDSSCRSSGIYKRATSGDFFTNNWYERPFAADMTYLPFIDIEQADVNYDPAALWVYADMWLVESPLAYADKNPQYGLEIDINRDSRGDYFILAALPPNAEWTTNGVKVYEDTNHDVGSTRAIMMDAPVNGNGYESLIFDAGIGSDPDLAWIRISPTDSRAIEIAFKSTLAGPEQKFFWAAWADAAMQKPEWMDYDDHFTQEEAGNPNPDMGHYPLKAFYGVDNTCRMGAGFVQTGNEMGACVILQPTEVPPQVNDIPQIVTPPLFEIIPFVPPHIIKIYTPTPIIIK